MADASLQDRLRDHAKAFDGLLSLIPAKMYYGEDTSDQWNKKKQTKQEAAAARRAKLDPDSELNRNAKEVMDERAKNKRKLREMQQEDEGQDDDEWEDYDPVPGVDSEKPGEGLKTKTSEANKKQKLDDDPVDSKTTAEATSSKLSRKEEKKAAKKEKKKEKKAEKKTKNTEGHDAEKDDAPAPTPKSQNKAAKKQAKTTTTKAQKQKDKKDQELDETPAARGDGES
ncbi:hypothetical protein NM208_g16956 [Fusarium decemcellulare]|uniref:Uncharacterized protein n=1 Tax=Fusarium decemcellulare TaxID=57161 RepID=A0ACC1RAM0_9HYPO|nr:hypothetical protein NM208_g16956 [Fusarium decemcellulare]